MGGDEALGKEKTNKEGREGEGKGKEEKARECMGKIKDQDEAKDSFFPSLWVSLALKGRKKEKKKKKKRKKE